MHKETKFVNDFRERLVYEIMRSKRYKTKNFSFEVISEYINNVMDIAKEIHEICMLGCNTTTGFSQSMYNHLDRLEKSALDISDPFNIEIIVSKDPRGSALKLVLPSGYTDDFAREGFCVPNSDH